MWLNRILLMRMSFCLTVIMFNLPIAFGQNQTLLLDAASTAVSDSKISIQNGTLNYGTGLTTSVMAHQSAATPLALDIERNVLKFDLAQIPKNAIVISAELKLVAQTIQNPNSFKFVFSRLSESWTENSITWLNQPAHHSTTDLIVSAPNTSSSNILLSVDVKAHVQNMVHYGFNNHGWQIRLEDETNATNINYGAIFYTANHTDPTLRPELEIVYRLPLEITGAVTHCTCDGNGDDGAITFSFSGGSGAYKSAVLQKLEIDPTKIAQNTITSIVGYYNNNPLIGNGFTVGGLLPGLYLLQLTDKVYLPHSNSLIKTYQNKKMKYFLIGQDGVLTEVLVSNWQYADQTAIANYTGSLSGNLTADTPYGLNIHNALRVSDYGTDLAGTATSYAYHIASLIDFNVHFSPDVDVLSANVHLRPYSPPYQVSNYSSNEVKFKAITEPWYAGVATWNSRPSVWSGNVLNLPSTSTPNGNTANHYWDTLNIMPFINFWKLNPSLNQGIEISMATYGVNNGVATRNYQKIRPNNNTHLRIAYTVSCGAADLEYLSLKRKLDGVCYDLTGAVDQILHVKYKEEYLDSDGILNAKIFSNGRVAQSFPSPSIGYGDNRLDIDISGLATGYYILEINNDKDETFFLRFQK